MCLDFDKSRYIKTYAQRKWCACLSNILLIIIIFIYVNVNKNKPNNKNICASGICLLCTKGFKSLSILKYHILSKHNIKWWSSYIIIPVFSRQMSICLFSHFLFYALTMYLPNFCACSHIFTSIYTCVLLSIQEKMLTQISMTQVYYYILSYMHTCEYFFNYCTQSDLNKVFYCSLTSPEISFKVNPLFN